MKKLLLALVLFAPAVEARRVPIGVVSAADPRAAVAAAVDAVNRDLSQIERVRRFILADSGFTVENEQLTPSMKVRRHKVREAYGERLDALYKG